jgi:anaerobic magnesium-protoporphyrin IX monomethyl ester cyclase
MSSKVLFIHPGNQRSTYQGLSGEYTAIATPVWTLLLAGHIRSRGVDVAIHDTNVCGWSEEICQDLLSKQSPSLIVIMSYGHNPSASTPTMPAGIAAVKTCKGIAPGIPVAFGGLHASALPERSLRESKADFVIIGEGHKQIDGLLKVVSGKLQRTSVPGIGWLDGKGGFERTAAQEPEANLDEAFPDYPWDLIPPHSKYRAHNSHTLQYFENSNVPDFSDVRSPYAVLYTSLGCPFKCSFCCINALFGKPSIRYWSVEKAVSWVRNLYERHGVSNIRLDDELFVLDPKRVEAFCDSLKDIGPKLNLWAYARLDTIKPNLLKTMRDGGFTWFGIGIESANANVRSGVSKGYKSDIERVVKDTQEAGINVIGNYMFGLPDDDLSTMKETLDLAKHLNCEFINFNSTMAYPGSMLYTELAAARPEAIPDDWNAFSQYSRKTLPLPTKHLSAGEVLAFRDFAFNDYFTSQRYLDLVASKFGAKALGHITKMTTMKLDRDNAADIAVLLKGKSA